MAAGAQEHHATTLARAIQGHDGNLTDAHRTSTIERFDTYAPESLIGTQENKHFARNHLSQLNSIAHGR